MSYRSCGKMCCGEKGPMLLLRLPALGYFMTTSSLSRRSETESARHKSRQLKEVLFDVINAFVSAIDARDHYTCGHSLRVARIAVCLGRELELPDSKLSLLYLAGLLHDVGKIGVPD